MKYINEKKYQRINTQTGEVIDELTVVGKMQCKANPLVCNEKCLGLVMVSDAGKKYCPYPEGVNIKEVEKGGILVNVSVGGYGWSK